MALALMKTGTWFSMLSVRYSVFDSTTSQSSTLAGSTVADLAAGTLLTAWTSTTCRWSRCG